MVVYLCEVVVTRHRYPENIEIHEHIKDVKAKILKEFNVPDGIAPHVGDIYYVNDIPYIVKRRIFDIDSSYTEMLCEVEQYDGNYIYEYGPYHWEESVPLATELLKNLTKNKQNSM